MYRLQEGKRILHPYQQLEKLYAHGVKVIILNAYTTMNLFSFTHTHGISSQPFQPRLAIISGINQNKESLTTGE
jgi:hypothetical protein